MCPLIHVDVFRAYAIRPYKIGHALRQSCRICNPEPFVDDADCKSAHVITLDYKSSVTGMLHFVTNDEFTICHNRMDFPQEIGTQHDK